MGQKSKLAKIEKVTLRVLQPPILHLHGWNLDKIYIYIIYIGIIKLWICPGKILHWLQRYIIVKLRSRIFKFHAERSVIYEMRFIISKTILRKCTWFRKWGPEFWKFTRKSHMERSTIFKIKSKIAHAKTQTYRSTIFTMWGKIFCINA